MKKDMNLKKYGDKMSSEQMMLKMQVDDKHSSRLQKMEPMNMTQLCDINPIIDDLKVLARYTSLWKSHCAGRPKKVWALDMVFQDAQGNRVQATVKNKNISKF
ncbi:hypothetical protein Tco_1318135 [Tanacetum coccineum]